VLELKTKGIDNAAALLGGLAAWKNAGYPVEGTAVKTQ
jgi:rhodanese-related sulfurtransferase